MSKISALRAENASVKLRLDALQADLAAGGFRSPIIVRVSHNKHTIALMFT
jgi:hypothetical protein